MDIKDLEQELDSVITALEMNTLSDNYSNSDNVTYEDLVRLRDQTAGSLKFFKTSIIKYLSEK